MVLDPRIGARMRRFELSAEEEQRAKEMVVSEEEVEGWIKGSLRGLGRSGVEYWRLRKKERVVDVVEQQQDLENEEEKPE